MPDLFYTALSHRAVMKLTGKDVRTFLQGLLTRNISLLDETTPLYALMLTPQGKFLYDFFVVQQGESVLLDYYLPKKAEILQKLRMYKLRAEVTITETDLPVFAIFSSPLEGEQASLRAVGGKIPAASLTLHDSPSACSLGLSTPPQGGSVTWVDPRDARIGSRAFNPPQGQQAPLTEYDRLRISLTIPDAQEDMPSGDCFPLHYRMDELHAVDFDKGCYVGQEVTTRSKHRGNIRKTLYTVEGNAPLPPAGTAVTVDGKQVGELRSSVEELGLALLEKEAVTTGAALPSGLKAGNVTVRIREGA